MKNEMDIASKMIANLKKKSLNLRIMHVCGTHQDTIVRNGLDVLFYSMGIDVREGPGCPVCVTTTREIENAKLFIREGKTLTLYGDMLRAPGERGSIETERSRGGRVIIVYSIDDAVKYARDHPNEDVIFLGVGFETTMPSTAVTLINDPPKNFFVYSLHRLTPPAVYAVLSSGRIKLDGIILPGHVSTIIGQYPWENISRDFSIPQVIAGFEPFDVIFAIYMLVEQIEKGESRVEIEYRRVVRREGNLKAQYFIKEVFENVDMEWRGFPVIPKSGMKIREKYSNHDAEKVFQEILMKNEGIEFKDPPGCRCGDVIRGELYPWECPLFGKVCRPETPVGPCMVSSEGACAIEYKYGTRKLNKFCQ